MAKKIIRICVEKSTPRIEFTFDFVFKERGLDYELVDSDADGIDLYYTPEAQSNQPCIACSGMLSETEITGRIPDFDNENRVFLFAQKPDYFASIFFVLSRMEEYLIPDRDHHGRFPVESSLQFQHNILRIPMCDYWSNYIIEQIPGIELPSVPCTMEPTFDIDNAFAFKYKKGLRRNLSVARDIVKSDKQRLKERKSVRKGEIDPYDTFDEIKRIAAHTQNARLFWLTESKGKFDRNLDISTAEIVSLIRSMQEFLPVSLHPSYGSFGVSSEIEKEKKKLEHILQSSIESSRQHFLRFELPITYYTLMESGIYHDYSMGFAGQCGFRLGTARSVRWFDLKSNTVSPMTMHPFVYMDGTLLEYMHLTPDASKKLISELYDEVKMYGGTFRFIWHNETIGNYGKWKGWKEVLDYTLKLHYE